jgi:Protein of unknown function (DUF3613)
MMFPHLTRFHVKFASLTKQGCLALALASGMTVACAQAAPDTKGEPTRALEQQAPVIDREASDPPDMANGRSTQAWLNAQAHRQGASRTRQTMSGPVMGKVHERYLKSFEASVPSRLRDETSFGSSK